MRTSSVRLAIFAIAFFLLLGVPQEVSAQARAVTGTITDARTGESITGAQVLIRDRGLGALTNTTGRFLLINLPEGRLELRVVFLGFAPQSRVIEVAAGETLVENFQLTVQAIQLDELVATGYAQQTRREMSSSIGVISLVDLEAPAVASLDALLQGKAAGLQVIQNAGNPGNGITVRIRGNSSISADNRPLYVVDGMPIFSGDFGQMWTCGFIRRHIGLTPSGGYYYMNDEVHDDKWHHVAIVLLEAELPNLHDDVRLYKDGELAEIHELANLVELPLERRAVAKPTGAPDRAEVGVTGVSAGCRMWRRVEIDPAHGLALADRDLLRHEGEPLYTHGYHGPVCATTAVHRVGHALSGTGVPYHAWATGQQAGDARRQQQAGYRDCVAFPIESSSRSHQDPPKTALLTLVIRLHGSTTVVLRGPERSSTPARLCPSAPRCPA